VDSFVHHYNEVGLHQASRCPPLRTWRAPDKGAPQLGRQTLLAITKVRHDRIDKTACFTLRSSSRLHQVGLGRAHAGIRVLILMADPDVGVIDIDGENLRRLELDPTIDGQK
jgi:hypothetical protein